MSDQLFTYYIEIPLVVISINSGSWGVMVIMLDIETWVIGEGGIKMGRCKRASESGNRCGVFCVFLGGISVVLVEGAFVRGLQCVQLVL
jgi:hypothetical protein